MSQEFKSGICECCNDPAGCVYTWFCYPCASAQMMEAARGGSCFSWFLCAVCPWTALGYNVMQRYVIRESYGIQGDVVVDCVETTFCAPCSQCQLQREVKERGPAKQTMN